MIKQLKRKKGIRLKSSIVLPMLSLMTFSQSYAATNYGKNLGDWLTQNVTGIIPGVLGIISVGLMFKRDWPKALSLGGITLVLAAFMNWETMKTISSAIVKIITG
ncbi:hypothetical protein JI735_33805 (plasmid) [Paenibacillus sonchi]|uniref:Uncharacterized protein n=1 Tax=Paenibacillus sonchi TaxID=373687 RepID=A0A974PJT8_9BACL|nr:hypothetical protein [Paenibacillus sonchi]QQZ64627.1 hypothetical protein JI735_33805 [Paenibacillus sonchi]